MAPTEILAEQHYHTLAPLLEKLGVRCALLTASTKAKTRRSILEQLAVGRSTLPSARTRCSRRTFRIRTSGWS